jgi:hypothetical protein
MLVIVQELANQSPLGLCRGVIDSIVQLVAEVPTGYFAYRVGRIASLRVGSLLAAIATDCYVIFHHKTGIYLGNVFEALGYSFMGGGRR